MTKRIDQFLTIIEAWKRRDIEAVLAMMSDDIVWHFAAGAEPALVGKAAARRFLTRFAADLAEVRWRIFHSAESGDRLFVEELPPLRVRRATPVSQSFCVRLRFMLDIVAPVPA